MKLISISLIAIFITNYGCNEKTQSQKGRTKYVRVVIHEDNKTPTVDIANYTLITDGANDRKADAQEILKVKRKWPLAMQTKDSSLFNSILAKDFTFNGRDQFYNRADYISDRILEDSWKITSVKYEDMVLQFFGENALLTYRNIIENKNTKGEVETEHITWADVYVKESENWKIAAAHSIDYRMSKPDTLK